MPPKNSEGYISGVIDDPGFRLPALYPAVLRSNKQSLDMFSQGERKKRGDGIPYLPVAVPHISAKFKRVWKALEPGGFSHCDRTFLSVIMDMRIAVSRQVRGDRSRWL